MASKRSDKQPRLSRTITLGEINSELTNDIIQLIYDINDEDIGKTQVEPIKLIINSFGGEVYSGLALIDIIDNVSKASLEIPFGNSKFQNLDDCIDKVLSAKN